MYSNIKQQISAMQNCDYFCTKQHINPQQVYVHTQTTQEFTKLVLLNTLFQTNTD